MRNKDQKRKVRRDNLCGIFFVAAISLAWCGMLTAEAVQHTTRVHAVSDVFNRHAQGDEAIRLLSKNGFSEEQAKRYPACYEYHKPKDQIEQVARQRQIVGNIINCLAYG